MTNFYIEQLVNENDSTKLIDLVRDIGGITADQSFNSYNEPLDALTYLVDGVKTYKKKFFGLYQAPDRFFTLDEQIAGIDAIGNMGSVFGKAYLENLKSHTLKKIDDFYIYDSDERAIKKIPRYHLKFPNAKGELKNFLECYLILDENPLDTYFDEPTSIHEELNIYLSNNRAYERINIALSKFRSSSNQFKPRQFRIDRD